MSPDPRRRSGTPARLLAAVALLVLILGGCAAAFDPTGPCSGDGKVPGAYPDLEALVPTSYLGNKPQLLDSGRTCTSESLGSLTAHGVKELRFAGGTWSTGTQSGLTLATFTSVDGPALQPDWLAEFYETSANAGKNVKSVDASEMAVGPDAHAKRLDVLNDESYQTVVVWSQGERVVAVLVANFVREVRSKDAHDKIVQTAVDALLAASSGG